VKPDEPDCEGEVDLARWAQVACVETGRLIARERVRTPLARWAQVACVETDRFCDRCGYSLRTQAVRRDPRTEVLLCRCPECGRFHPAAEAATVGRVWLQRLATVLLACWIMFIASTAVTILVSQGAITCFTLDELTRTVPARMLLSGRSVNYTHMLVPRTEYRELGLLYTVSGSTSLGLGLVASFAAVIVLPHWRRRAYTAVAVAVAWPIAVALVVVYIWRQMAPHLTAWGASYIWGHTPICVLGGVVGVMIGRPLARAVVRACLPPRVRPVLSFLWLADGMEPPSGAR
jgi:hypothetical protein